MARRKKKFIQKAIKRPGSLTRLAKRAGTSINRYCAKVLKAGRKKYPKSWYKCHLYVRVLKKVGRKRKK